MSKSISKYIVTFFIFCFWFLSCYAQNKKTNSTSGFNLTTKIGASQLIAEMPNSMSGAIYEFNNQPGISYSFELSKNLSNNLTVGIELSNSTLKGKNFSPAFSATGVHPAMMDPINEPVKYLNLLSNRKVFVQYFFPHLFKGKTENPIKPFLRAGAGYMSYKSEFGYIQNSEDGLIFGKNYANYKAAKNSNADYFLGTGFVVPLSSKINVNTLLNFNVVNYDFLDVVHNYDSAGRRLELVGIYSELLIGVTYRFSKNKKPSKRKGTGNHKKSDTSKFLPWYKHKK